LALRAPVGADERPPSLVDVARDLDVERVRLPTAQIEGDGDARNGLCAPKVESDVLVLSARLPTCPWIVVQDAYGVVAVSTAACVDTIDHQIGVFAAAPKLGGPFADRCSEMRVAVND